MGRGRQKAKQTKVARKLKYKSHEMDLEALQRELSGKSGGGSGDGWDDDPYAKYAEPDYDKWADYADSGDDGDDDDWGGAAA